MKKVKNLTIKAISIILCVLMMTGNLALLSFAEQGEISYWDGSNETPGSTDLNPVYPDDLWTTTENDVNVLHIKSARGLMLYANMVKNKNWFTDWYVKLDTDVDLGAAGWMGIGDSGNNVFTGTFDGQGHTIYNMTVPERDNDRGFFRKVRGATIKNISFDSCTVSTNNLDGITHGVVVGWCDGNDCAFENVTVIRAQVYGDCYLGGIAGASDANITFINCRNLSTEEYTAKKCDSKDYFVYGNDGQKSDSGVGGIVGRVSSGKKLVMQNCVNSSYVHMRDGNNNDYRIGGMVGWARGELVVTDCTNYGIVGNIDDRRGLTAGIAGNTSSSITVENCSNYGDIYGSDHTGGIIGWHTGTSSSIKNCKNYGNVNGSAEQAGGIIALFDSNDNITLENCYNSGNISAPKHSSGIIANSKGHVYATGCVNDGEIVTRTDGHAAGICSYIDDDASTFTDCINNGAVICGTDKPYNNLSGILATLGGSVANATYSFIRCENHGPITGASANGGIAGYTSGNNNPTVVFTDCKNTGRITCNGGEGDCGGIGANIGGNGQIRLTNTFNTGEVVSGGTTVAGLIGRTYGFVTVENCGNSGNISGSTKVAGLFGYIQDDASSFKDSYNSGNITGNGERCAGLVASFEGNNEMRFVNCENSGSVTTTGNHTGGLLAFTEGVVTVESCKNTGNITTDGEWVGGIVGFIRDDTSSIRNTSNTGNITGYTDVGGIVGKYEKSRTLVLDNCSNIGDIMGKTNNIGYGGGLVGVFGGSEITINKCFNGNGKNGSIGADNQRFTRAGGFVGYSNTARITDSYNNAPVFSSLANGCFVGGLIGENSSNDTTIRYCYNAGELSGYHNNGNGGTLAGSHNPSVIKNSYYLSGSFSGSYTLQGEAVSASVFKSADMVKNHGQYLRNGNWAQDSEKVNSGYPVLSKENTSSSTISANSENEGVYSASLQLSVNNVDVATTVDYTASGEDGVRETGVTDNIYHKSAQYDESRWNSSYAKIYLDPEQTKDMLQTEVSISLTIPYVYSKYNNKGRWGVELFGKTDGYTLGVLDESKRTVTVTSEKGKTHSYELCDMDGNAVPSAETNNDFTQDANLSGSSFGPFNRWWIKGAVPESGDSVTIRIAGLCAAWAGENNIQLLTAWTDLTVYSVTKKALKAAIDYPVLAKENYSQASYATYEQALENAKAVYNSAYADQNEIDSAELALRNAINGLYGDFDFTGLISALEAAIAVDNSKTDNLDAVHSWKEQALSTVYSSQAAVDEMAYQLRMATYKTVKIPDAKEGDAVHSQNTVNNNWATLKGTINVSGANSAVSSYFNSDNNNGSKIYVSDTYTDDNGYENINRYYQTAEKNSQAMFDIDRYSCSDLSELGKFISAYIYTDGSWHQHSLNLVSKNDVRCFSDQTVTVTGVSGASYTYSLVGGGMVYGTPSGDWEYNGGQRESEYYAGISGAVPQAGDSVTLRVMIRPATLAYNSKTLVSSYGWVDIVINSYDSAALRNAINTSVANESVYTKASFADYKKALDNALIVLASSTTQKEIDSAAADLYRAISMLVEKSGTTDDVTDSVISVHENNSNTVSFYAPEVIFLDSDSSAYSKHDKYNFKSFIDYRYDDKTHKGTLNTSGSDMGAVDFYCENASDIAISFKYLNKDFSEMLSLASALDVDDTHNFANSTNNIVLYGSMNFLKPSNTTNRNTEVTLPGNQLSFAIDYYSLSPYLLADATGCYIEWTVDFTVKGSDEKRSINAYTYLHKTGGDDDVEQIKSALVSADRQALRSAYRNALATVNKFGMNGTSSIYFDGFSADWNQFTELFKAAGLLLSNTTNIAGITVNNTVYSCESLATALNYMVASLDNKRVSSSVNVKFMELKKDEFGVEKLYDFSDSVSADYFYGNSITVTPLEISGYECIGYIESTDISSGNTVDKSTIVPIDTAIVNTSVMTDNLIYTLIYKPKTYSSIVNTNEGIFNYIRVKTDELPTNFGGMGYPSYDADSSVETDISYRINGNTVTVWTEGPTRAEKYQFLPLYADLRASTDYKLTYEVSGASADSVIISLYNSEFKNGNEYKDTYSFAESGSMISTGTDSGAAYFKVELIGDARSGNEVIIKNICLSIPNRNEMYLQTSEEYPQNFVPAQKDKMKMIYNVLSNTDVSLTSQYSTLMYYQRQLLPYYAEMKSGMTYSFDYSVSGLKSSDVIISLYNADFTNGNYNGGHEYLITAGEPFVFNDNGIAQLKVEFADGVVKDSTAVIRDMKLVNLDSKTIIDGIFNETVSLGIPVKEGYIFAGWELKANEGEEIFGTLNRDDNTYTFGSGSDMLEAKWIPDVLRGDVNLDGHVDGMDAVLVRCIIAGMLTESDLTDIQLYAADYNEDGSIDTADSDSIEAAGIYL